MEKLILIKYGELTTKKDNRKFFVKTLEQNILKKLKNIKIEKTMSRMYITYDEREENEILEQLQKIFGIHSIVICDKVNTNEDEIKNKILEILKNKQFKTFKVSTKRSDKTFEHTSMEFNNIIGGLVLRNFDCKVDVHNPELNLEIEIRKEGTYIYNKEIKGLGGYPVGIQGNGM